jgi:undecaprenol kinase
MIVELRAEEWIVILLLVGSVLALEMINSIFERIVDTFKPRIHPAVRDIKDIMAATVLVASLIAAIIGLTIFIPEIKDLLGS